MFYQPLLRKSTWLKSLGLINKSKFGTSSIASNIQTSLKDNGIKSSSSIDLKEGQVLSGFMVDQITPIKEMYLTAIKLTHLNTGAQYLHLDRDDSNNVFSIGFRTTPMDSTGLPHILEHMALCGSDRYPCRDPFFKMLRRSLATFMNAMTAPDYTFYPFSTQNLRDFRNLQSVYLDSVFRPQLRELDFFQEGWRMEHTDPNDKKSPIIFKGVVYNEMKGVFNSNQNIFVTRLLNSLLPSHTYGVISGGDPLEIPKLNYEDLVHFHATHYHPSNARFYSYGNFPLKDHLKFINDNYLFLADKINTSKTKVPSESRWSAPKKEHILCRPDPLIADSNRQNAIAIASLCNDITNIQEGYDVYILAQLLLDGPNSAFYKSLVDTNIGTGFGPMTGYESQVKDTIFIVSLQGVQECDFEKVERIYNETVAKVIEDGFQRDHIEAVLHRIELQVKHQTSNFGLNLLYNVMPLWNHDADIMDSLKINKAIQNFKDRIQRDPNYLSSLIEKYLLNNSHKLTMTMSPSQNFEKQLVEAENALLESKLKNLTPEQLDGIFKNGQALLIDQQKEENVDSLPGLKIEDLKEDVDRYDLVDTQVCNVPVQVAVQPTNGVCYYRGLINTQHLSPDLKNVLPIFNDVVTKMGTQRYDYRDWDKLMQLKTGGLSFSNHAMEHKVDNNRYEEGIAINSYCLEHNAEEMWKLWEELFNRVELTDLQRFETLVKMAAADVTNRIANSGHLYSMSSAASLVSPIGRYKENLSGMEFVNRIKHIAQMKDLSLVLEQVQEIAKQVLTNPSLRSAINSTGESMNDILKNLELFYDALDKIDGQQNRIFTSCAPMEMTNKAVHHVLPYAVNYASKVVSTVPYSHPDHAPLQVLSKLISSSYLHPEIREKGGAYGGGSTLGADGTFYFYSYRDPGSTRTLDIFDGTWDFLAKTDITEEKLVEAKLQIFQKLDAPVAPGNRGMNRFFNDLSFDDVQSLRERLRAVNGEQLLDVAKRYLSPDAKNVKIGRALIGPRNADLKSRSSENWEILEQEEQCQAQAI
ncbi:presequence protease, mitochondrial [Copidosoma floridanum]|uniref:presequence protease, mitochondrial n=1 Tax=Copidosoma floridanum TaxID=29053 RepID=UPI0006C9A8D6|nr:presequence protease, mitochondrial [Copidosoma floridanum]XP_023247095.1 presequence protease, mitochondrial [Copidosoma floridanum]